MSIGVLVFILTQINELVGMFFERINFTVGYGSFLLGKMNVNDIVYHKKVLKKSRNVAIKILYNRSIQIFVIIITLNITFSTVATSDLCQINSSQTMKSLLRNVYILSGL